MRMVRFTFDCTAGSSGTRQSVVPSRFPTYEIDSVYLGSNEDHTDDGFYRSKGNYFDIVAPHQLSTLQRFCVGFRTC